MSYWKLFVLISFAAMSSAVSQPFDETEYIVDSLGWKSTRWESSSPFQELGYNVNHVGDINGDGLSDVIFCSRPASRGYDIGHSAVVDFGRRGLPVESISTGDVFFDGFYISSPSAGTAFEFGSAGDFNGDGFSDIIVNDAAESGHDYPVGATIVFGRPSFPYDVEVDRDIDGVRGVNLMAPRDTAGYDNSVAAAGDINGDGYDDVLVGRGPVYVIFGRPVSPPVIELSTLDGEDGFVFDESTGSLSSNQIAAAGDFNQDGFADFAVATDLYGEDQEGAVFVVFGQSTFGALLLASELDGENGFSFFGTVPEEADGGLGNSLAGGWDMNGDDHEDLLVSARRGGNGAAFVLFGGAEPAGAVVLDTDLDGVNGIEISYSLSYPARVELAMDMNGDGFDEILLDGDEEVNVVFGRNDFPAFVDAEQLIDGVHGFRLKSGEPHWYPFFQFDFGFSFDGIGDFNGDGLGDLLIGSPSYDTGGDPDFGAVYTFYGRAKLSLSSQGSCPGRIGVTVENAAPNAEVMLFAAHDLTGSTRVFDCGATELELADPFEVTIIQTDEHGFGRQEVLTTEKACGSSMQLVDLSTCYPSLIEPVP